MSGPCIHYLIARRLHERFEARVKYTLGGKPISEVLKDHPVHVSAGAQGPDFLFFLLSDLVATAGAQAGETAAEEGNLLGGRMARATLDASAQIEELNARLFEAHPILEDLLDEKEKLEATIEDTVERSKVLSAMKQSVDDLEAIVDLMMGTAMVGVKATLADTVDIFSMLSHPMQAADPLERWWWFDVLHYRRSGEYATALIQRAIDLNDEELLAYAIGYTSHYSADTVGHPYVNTIVRGPYRHHGQRHKVVENGHDVWAWRTFGDDEPRTNTHIDIDAYLVDRFGKAGGAAQAARLEDGEFATSQLHLEFQFDPRFVTSDVAVSEEERSLLPTLDPAVALPDAIAEGIQAAMTEIYGKDQTVDGHYPRIPDPDEIKVAYRLWYGWFKGSTSNGVLPPALSGHVPLTEDIAMAVEEILTEAAQKAVDAAKKYGPEAKAAAGDLVGMVKDLFDRDFDGSFNKNAVIGMLTELAKKIVEELSEVGAILEEILGSLAEKSLSVVRTVLNIAYQKLYSVYLNMRKLLAASGLGFPLTSMLDEHRFAHMTTPGRFPDAAGRHLSHQDVRDHYPVLSLPRAGFEVPFLGETGPLSFIKGESHLIYPPTVLKTGDDPKDRVEQPDQAALALAATPGPAAYADETPDFYMWATSSVKRAELDRFLSFGDTLRSARPSDVGRSQATLPAPDLGNALDLTVALVGSVMNGLTLPNVNLDGDRGMAFPSWLMADHWREAMREGRLTPDEIQDLGTVNYTPDPRSQA